MFVLGIVSSDIVRSKWLASCPTPSYMAPFIALNLTLEDGHGIAVVVICATGMFFCLCMLVLILMYRRLKSIMVSSPTFCCIQLLGILMGYLGCLMYVGKPNPAICIARQFIITTGFILVVGSLIAKSYRYVDLPHMMMQ